MAKIKLNPESSFIPKHLASKVVILNEFIPEKTSDRYLEVKFIYDDGTWFGAVPLKIVYHGTEVNAEKEIARIIELTYESVKTDKRAKWKEDSDSFWENRKQVQTYKVLEALELGEWCCRVCGPVPQASPQAAARIRDLKKMGYTIASKRRQCKSCKDTTLHDLLVMIPRAWWGELHNKKELRSPISNQLKDRIKTILGCKEAFFDVKRTKIELVIDHKFPSQRWDKPESPNDDKMSEKEIRAKFQLMTNQTNMWKSRVCDECVRTDQRGTFLGLIWYYKGNRQWRGKTPHDEEGCVGCPWYDTQLWREKFNKRFSDEKNKSCRV